MPEKPMTAQMEGALQWLASRGEMTVRRQNTFIMDEISVRTAWGLERRGYAERRWTGAEDGVIYITQEGREAADRLLGDEEKIKDSYCVWCQSTAHS